MLSCLFPYSIQNVSLAMGVYITSACFTKLSHTYEYIGGVGLLYIIRMVYICTTIVRKADCLIGSHFPLPRGILSATVFRVLSELLGHPRHVKKLC